MDINDLFAKDGDTVEVRNLKAEARLWKSKYERTVKLCKCIAENTSSINEIKFALHEDVADDLWASQLWNELDPETQKLLITAPRFGGPFTTKERANIRDLWEITEGDL